MLSRFKYMLRSRETHFNLSKRTRTGWKNKALVRATPFCGEYLGPWFEDEFRPANQMDGISITGGGKMADS